MSAGVGGEASDRKEGRGTAPRRSRPGRSFLWMTLAVVVAFGAGFLWQYTAARSAQGALDEAERELAYQRLGNLLGAATVQAGYENYEPARQLASRFYSDLDRHLREESPAPGEGGGQTLRELLQERDDMITALSRANPDAEDLLASAFLRFHGAVGIEDPGPQVPATAGSGRSVPGEDAGADADTPRAPSGGPGGSPGGPPGPDDR